MKKSFFYFFLVLCHLPCFSQSYTLDSATYKRYLDTKWGGFSLQYNFNSFSKSLTPDDFSRLNSISLKFIASIDYMSDTFIELEYYIPEGFQIDEEAEYEISGFSYQQPLYPQGIDLLYFTKQYNNFQYDLPAFLGVGLGSLYLKERSSKYRNFFLNFSFQLHPRIVLFKKLILGGQLAYYYDITKPVWKSKGDLPPLSFGHKHTFLKYGFTIGWILRNTTNYVRVY